MTSRSEHVKRDKKGEGRGARGEGEWVGAMVISVGIVFAKKNGGGMRPCVDFRGLNEATKNDRTSLQNWSETWSQIKVGYSVYDVVYIEQELSNEERKNWIEWTALNDKRLTRKRSRFRTPSGVDLMTPNTKRYVIDLAQEPKSRKLVLERHFGETGLSQLPTANRSSCCSLYRPC